MNCYQIIYAATRRSLTGSAGFGITAATKDTPQEILDLVSSLKPTLCTYSAGKFNAITAPGDVLFEHPERIYEYPKHYYYEKFQSKDGKRTYYAIGRSVSICYDYKFFIERQKVRPGNQATHIFIFDEVPPKAAFDLLFENPTEGSLRFRPVNYEPRLDNEELESLELSKNPEISQTELQFEAQAHELNAEALDVLFSYRASLETQKPLMVSIEEARSLKTIAALMYILPESLVKDATFALNYQVMGQPKNERIVFINEYYGQTVFPNLVHLADIKAGKRTADAMETYWRAAVESALQAEDRTLSDKLIAWIFNSFTPSLLNESKQVNDRVFEYCNYPEKFRLYDEKTLDNHCLERIAAAVDAGCATSGRMVELLCENFSNARDARAYAAAINWCEKVEKAGFDIAEVLAFAKEKMSAYLLESDENFVSLVENLSLTLFRKYTDSAKVPPLKQCLPSFLHCGIAAVRAYKVAGYLETSVEARVALYMELLNADTENFVFYNDLIRADWDCGKLQDFLMIFKNHLNCETLAPYFHYQLIHNTSSMELHARIKTLKTVAKSNQAFALALLKESPYQELYDSLMENIDNEELSELPDEIRDNILSLLPDNSPARAPWFLLYNVLVGKYEDSIDASKYWKLAKLIGNDTALKAVSSKLVSFLNENQIAEELKLVKEKLLISDEELLKLASALKSRNQKCIWLKNVALIYAYDYEKLESWKEAFDLTRHNSFEMFVKENLPALYRKHKTQVFFNKVKSIFKRNKTEQKKSSK